MTYVVIILCWALFVVSVIATGLWVNLRKEREAWAEKWATRSVGHVVSSEETKRGMEVDVEITDKETWDKIKRGVLGSVSIGPMNVDELPTHRPRFDVTTGRVIDDVYVPPEGFFGVKRMRRDTKKNR